MSLLSDRMDKAQSSLLCVKNGVRYEAVIRQNGQGTVESVVCQEWCEICGCHPTYYTFETKQM